MTISGSRSSEEVQLETTRNLQNKQAHLVGYPPSWISCVISLVSMPRWLTCEKGLLYLSMNVRTVFDRCEALILKPGESAVAMTI